MTITFYIDAQALTVLVISAVVVFALLRFERKPRRAATD